MISTGTVPAGILLLIAGLSASGVKAGEADVLDAEIRRAEDGYFIAATVRHADEGWQHYADGWEAIGPDGSVVATRALAHPHVQEQPFRRSLSGVAIPEGIAQITLRAHDSRHGYGGKTLTIDVPR